MPGRNEYLEVHGGKFRVSLAVPRDLHKVLGTRLKKALHTDSLSTANRLKGQVIADFRALIAHKRRLAFGETDAVLKEAVAIAAVLGKAIKETERDEILEAIREREAALCGVKLTRYVDHETGQEEYDWVEESNMLSTSFSSVARGRATPINIMHREYLDKSRVKARTKADDIRAIKFLTEWCKSNRIPAMLEEINRTRAVRFVDDLEGLTGGLQARTLNKYIGRLSQYWSYLGKREPGITDVWMGLALEVPQTKHDEEERAFKDEEVRQLLIGPASQKMRDLILFGALTGARLDAIVDLKIKDTADRILTFKPQKKERVPRDIPAHPALIEIIDRRSIGKGPDDDLFPEWPSPKKLGSMRERSFKASNEFTAYRRECGVDEVVEGKRRSLVNYHSFRRWFITKAERAGYHGDLVAAIVGHKRSGMTLGRYSEGPEMRRARRCIAAVRLPDLDKVAREQRALTPRKRASAGKPGQSSGQG